MNVMKELKKEYPYTYEYVERYGWDLPPYFFGGSMMDDRERFLKKCLEEGKTWQEVSPAKKDEIY